jgi:hypothetical protein
MTVARVSLVFALAAASASTAGAAADRTLVFTVRSVQTYTNAVDVPPNGFSSGRFSAGDYISIRDNLFNRAPQLGKPTGAKVGTDQSRLTFLGSTQAEVVGSASLPGGTVSFKGRVSARVIGVISLAITGGTGRYAGARGKVTEPASDTNAQDATNTYHLILP